MDKGLEFEGGGLRSVLHQDGAVVLVDDMEDDAIVGFVGGMVVLIPVGGTEVNLDISSPFDATDGDSGVEEIGACIAVELTGAKNDNRLAIGGGQPSAEHLVMPDIM